MVFPSTPLDMVTEIYTGDWETLTADVYNRQPVTIRWGAPNEGGAIEPTKLTQQWNNRSGRYSSRNPLSDLYGLIGRNTPLRFSVRTVVDTFTRTVTDGWGDADTGQEWSTFSNGGTAADFDVAAGAGTMVVDGDDEHRGAWLADDSYLDVELRTQVSIDVTTPTDGDLEPAALLVRMQSSTLYYMIRPVVTEALDVRIDIWHEDGGVGELLGSVTVEGLTYSGQTLAVAGHIEGRVLRAKVWDESEPEPLGWHLAVADDRILTPGGIGIRCGLEAGNTDAPVTFTIDNFEARLPLAHVELSKLPPRWDVSQVDRWVPVEASGIRRRLGQGKTPLQSAMFRAMMLGTLSTGLLAYWPLTDGPLTTRARSPLSGVASLPLSSGVTLAAVDRPNAGSEPYAVAANVTAFPAVGLPGSTPGFTAWSGLLRGTMPMPSTARAVIWQPVQVVFADGDITRVNVQAYALWTGTEFDPLWTGVDVLITGGTGVGSVAEGATINVFDGQPHDVQIRLEQVGADVLFELWFDGEMIGDATSTTKTLGSPHSIEGPQPSSGTLDGITVDNTETTLGFGHYAVHVDSTVPTPHTPAIGHAGETAAARIQRLCEEQGIPIVIVGDSDTSEPMGAQRQKTLMVQLNECEAADHGRLFEPRGASGFVYRTRRTFYNQAAWFELPYGHLTPFEPVDDDAHARNDVTVTREGGASFRKVLETGRLSIQDPPDGIGPVDTSVTLNLDSDDRVAQHAGWLLHLGTWDESRYPSIRAHLTRVGRDDQALMHQLAAAGVRDRFTITGTPGWLSYDPIEQLAEGGTHTLHLTDWELVLNAGPFGPYQVFELEHPQYGRFDTKGSALVLDLDETEDELIVATDSGRRRWVAGDAITAPQHFPFVAQFGGEEVVVNEIEGTVSPQIFHVTRSYNGVVKSHAAGTDVRISRTAAP